MTTKGKSPASEKLSPIYSKEIKRAEINKQRIVSQKKQFKIFASVFSVLFVETILLRSSILSFILQPVFPWVVTQFLEIIALAYVFAGTVSSFYDVSVTELPFFKWLNGTSKKSEFTFQSPNSTAYHDMSADLSWVDSHRFGTPLTKEVSFFKGTDPATPVSSPVSPRAQASQRKADMSIHTREQLDRLLMSDSDAPVTDFNQTQNSFLSSANIFDAMADSANKSYHVSEAILDNETSPYKVKVNQDGRVTVSFRGGEETDELTKMKKMMQQVRTSPEKGILKRSNSMERSRGVRRMSHSSPERQTDKQFSDTAHKGPLTDAEVKGSEGKVRAWICNTILKPLVKRIDELNEILEKENLTPSPKIGVSNTDALKLAMIERESLKTSTLPFVLPFLQAHTNQAYLVNRIRELSKNELMNLYTWNKGGEEPRNDKGLKQTRKPWTEALPTDAALIFHLFSTYMDSQLNSNPVIGGINRLDQPFSARYTLKFPEKPTKLHQTPFSYYIHLINDSPPQFEFVHNDMWATPTKIQMGKHNANLFNAITHLVHHVKEENDGFLDKTSIGPHGLNLTVVL